MCPVGRLYTHVPSWAIVHSYAQLGDCTHMCPVGRLYTHVPSWAIVHTCAQLGDCTLMCPVGRWYTHVPSWAIVHSCAQLGNDTHVLSIMLMSSWIIALTHLGYCQELRWCIKLEIIGVTKPTAATLVLST